MGTCLGDEFSVNWMEDSESSNPFSETLDQQYKLVKSKTLGSPVQKFGDFDLLASQLLISRVVKMPMEFRSLRLP